MKILVFGDSHCDLMSIEAVREKADKADLIVCLGDISWFEEGLDPMLALINEFPKQVLMIHGNHERLDALQEFAKQYENIEVGHGVIVQVDDYDFVLFGGDGFTRVDPEFEGIKEYFIKNIRDPKKTICVFHGPPYDTNLDIPFADYHSGSMSYRSFIEEVQPLAVFVGHIHECEGQDDYINHSYILNPGREGRIIDLNALHQVRQ